MKKSSLLLTISLVIVLIAGCAHAQLSRPRNVIIMIADGCGFNHVEAASLYQFGTPDGWAYQRFPVRLAMSTFPNGSGYDPALAWTDFAYFPKGCTDSAAAATAMASGVKTYNGAIGVGPDKQPVKNVLERAEELGKASGVVTSVPFSHATPAGFLAHNAGRGNYTEIALSMLNSAADVIMGAGNPLYDVNAKLLAAPKFGYIGQTEWEQLVAGQMASDANGDGKPDAWKLVQTQAEFEALAQGETPARVFGCAPVSGTLQQGRSGDAKASAFAVPFTPGVPTLSQLTLAALNVLDNDPDGFCVMIEGGAVDFASHANQSGRMIEEEIDFSRAVEAAIKWIESHGGWGQTLLIVTGDHETGYPTGPGSNPEWKPLVGHGQGQMPEIQWNATGHTNNLIPFFANGAGSETVKTFPQQQDSRRGAYIDNTCVAKLVFSLWR